MEQSLGYSLLSLAKGWQSTSSSGPREAAEETSEERSPASPHHDGGILGMRATLQLVREVW
jgi:hypothetical protein